PSGGKVIALVSALPGEGKTTVAASFAAFVAKSGGRVLVVDADLRNPSMTNTLGYTNAPGLLDMVAGNVTFDELVIT
ncbi:AAA family ATPase, partial [Acinetobacter baumannii]